MRLDERQAGQVRRKEALIVAWASRNTWGNRWFEDEVGKLYVRTGPRRIGTESIRVIEFATLEIHPDYRHRGAMTAIMRAALGLKAPYQGLYIEGLDIRRNALWHRSLVETGWIETPMPSRASWFTIGLPDMGERHRSLGITFSDAEAWRRHVDGEADDGGGVGTERSRAS